MKRYFLKGQALKRPARRRGRLGLAEKAWPYKYVVCFLLVASFLFHAPKAHAVSCIRSDTGTTTLNSVCTLDGIPKYDVSGNEISRVGIINSGDLTVSGADVTVQPNTVIVWPVGQSINIQNGGRLLLGSGASLTQAEPLTYQFQALGFTLNAAGDPVKVVNNNLQVCSAATCTVALPAGAGNIVVEGLIKYADGTTQSTAPVSGVGGSGSSGYLSKFTAGTTLANSIVYDTGTNVGIGSTVPGAKLEVAGNINTTTGAIQTGSVTRIDNNGVGTFAAGTTIGGSGIPGGSGLNSVQTFTSSGTWTKPAGVTKIIVEVAGAGGGGGGGGQGTGNGGGGGAGGYANDFIDVTSVSSETVTVGAAGAGAAGTYGGSPTGGGNTTCGHASASYGWNGCTGGTSSFGAYVSATGGSGGAGGGSYNVGGGNGSGGAGGVGSNGINNITSDAGQSVGDVRGGRGAMLGANGGNGGSGGGCDNCAGAAGSSGIAGKVVVWEYK